MATATKTTSPDPKDATEQLAAFSDRLVASTAKVGAVYVDTFEKAVGGVAAFEREVARVTPNEVAAAVVSAHADLTTELTRVYANATRELLAQS